MFQRFQASTSAKASLISKPTLISWEPTPRQAFLIQSLNDFYKQRPKSDRTSRLEKYRFMQNDVVSFFRGTNHLFWQDLFRNPILNFFSNEKTRCWINGDANIMNCTFNYYMALLLLTKIVCSVLGSDGKVEYGLNHFDNAVMADYQYDVLRLAVSLDLQLRNLNLNEKSSKKQVLTSFLRSYTATCENIATSTGETKHCSGTLLSKFLTRKQNEVQNKYHFLKRFTKLDPPETGKRVFIDHGATAPAFIRQSIELALLSFPLTTSNQIFPAGYFQIKDVITKRTLLGEQNRFFVLIQGPSRRDEEYRNVILELRQQFSPHMQVEKEHNGRRVTMASRAHSKDGNIVDGWVTMMDNDEYSVQERNHVKETFQFERDPPSIQALEDLGKDFGDILARSHCRSGNFMKLHSIENDYTSGSLASELADLFKGEENKKEFTELMGLLAMQYSDQVVMDFQHFRLCLKQELKEKGSNGDEFDELHVTSSFV